MNQEGDNFDINYCQTPEKIGQITKDYYEEFLIRETVQELFRKFTYNIENEAEFIIENKEEKNKEHTIYNNLSKKFINPHYNLSSIHSTSISLKKNTIDPSLPSIYKNKFFNYKILDSPPSEQKKFNKLLKKSNSELKYNFIKKQSISGIPSFYFQN